MISLKENQFIVWAKIGDKQTAPGKEHLGIKHLMPVCYYLPEWMAATHKSVEDWFGGYAAGKCFATLILDKTEWLDRIIRACTYPVGDPADKFNYRPRDMVFDVAAVEAVTKDAQILSKWQSPYVVNPVDCCAMTKAAALDATKMMFTSLSAVNDFNAVSAGTYSYGDGTKDYATRALAYADIANLTGNLTFGQDVACTESATATITESLGGFVFTDTSNSSHLGNPNAGYISTIGDIIAISLQQEGPGTTNICNLYLKRGATTAARQTIYSVTVTTACTLNIYNNLIDFAGNNGHGINTADADQPANIYNNKIWDNTVANSRAIYLQVPNANTVVENNTIYNGSIGIDAVSSAVTIRNNMTLSCTNGFLNVASATGRNNVDTGTTCENTDFATGSGNVTSATALNEVISVTDTDATFLQVRTDATNANDGGAAPGIAGNTTGIEGNARPTLNGTTSIGCHQWLSAITYTGTGAPSVPASTGLGNGTYFIITGTGAMTIVIPVLAGVGTIPEVDTSAVSPFARLRAALKYRLKALSTIIDAYDPPKSADAMTRFPAVNIIWESEQVENMAVTFGGPYHGNKTDYTILATVRLDCFFNSVDLNAEMDALLAQVQEYIGNYYWMPDENDIASAFDCAYLGCERYGMDQQKPNGYMSIMLSIRYIQNARNPNG